jgi:hypothetical protein
MDQKFAIVTWYRNGNYGGTLQAYALQKTLEFMGFDSEFINFCPEQKRVSYRIVRFLKDVIIFCYKPKLYKSREKIYKFIHDNLKVSQPYYSYSQLSDNAEGRYWAAICGSDQIWAPVGGKVEPLNYLTFINEGKRIAYAPSIGYNRISEQSKDTFKKFVNGIRFLSIREKQGAEIIKENTGRNAQVVLDPSLLLTKEQWEKEIKRTQTKGFSYNKEYIFCYFIGRNSEYARYAYKLSRYTGYPIVTLDSKRSILRGVEIVIADPFDFLQFINNATYVLTDSFHGTAFSIIFEKQFGVFKRFKDNDPICQNSRIYNILEKTQLENRLITMNTPLSSFIEEKIDYHLVNDLLENEREKSLEYLKEAISTVLNSG